MSNLSAAKRAHVSALMSWNGMDYNQALELANSSTCEELDQQSYASSSIMAAKWGIEKHILNGKMIKTEYLTGEESAPEGYFENLGRQISQDMSREQVMTSVMTILKEIHDTWVTNNAKKYNRDAEKQDKRLFQHLPIQMIGIDEVAKDLMFLAPILEELGIDVGKMEQQPWGQFVPTEEVASMYARLSDSSLKHKGITRENLSQKLPEIIDSYQPLQGQSDVAVARKQYMLERTGVLASQVSNCLSLDAPVA